jgi:hypothetical protein
MKTRQRLMILLALGVVWTGACRRSAEPPQETSFPPGVPRDLLNPDLSNCRYPASGWSYENGLLSWRDGQGDVWTKDQYGDFTLELEWKIAAGTNSGVIFRCADPNDWMHTGLEVQIHEGGDGTKHGQVAGLYDLVSPNFYQNARVEVSRDGDTQSFPPVPMLKHDLGDGLSVSVKKVFTNLKLMERNGRQLPYNASGSDATNPAVLCDWTTATETTPVLVYPDGTRDGFSPPGYTLTYRTGHWLPDLDVRKPVGEWNHLRLTAKGPHIQVELNGAKVVDIDLDAYTEAGRNPQQTLNKYPVAGKDLPRRGYIALQDHGKPVWFRNIKITPL